MDKNLVEFRIEKNKIISKITINVEKNNKTYEKWVKNFEKVFQKSFKEYKFSNSFLNLEFKIKEKEIDFLLNFLEMKKMIKGD